MNEQKKEYEDILLQTFKLGDEIMYLADKWELNDFEQKLLNTKLDKQSNLIRKREILKKAISNEKQRA